MAVQGLYKSQTWLGDFFRRMRAKAWGSKWFGLALSQELFLGDETETGTGFSHNISLKEGLRMR